MRRPVSIGVISLALALVLARAAAADSTTDAAQVSKEAEALANAGDFAGAIAHFRQANRLDPRAEFVCDIGIAYRKANDLPKAQRFLADCLLRATTFDPKFVGLLRGALAEVEDALRAGAFTPVEITAEPAGASIALDGDAADEAFVGSRIVWVPFGAHDVVASADGFVARHVAIAASTQERQAVRVVLDRVPVAAAPVTVPPAPSQPAPVQPVPVVAPRDAVPSRLGAVVTLATGGALVLTATALYVHARSVNASAGSPTIDMDEYQARLSSAAGYQHAAWAVGGAAAVTCALGGFLWLRAGSPIEIMASSRGAAVTYTRAW